MIHPTQDMIHPTQTLLLIEDFAPDRELYRRCLLSDAEYAYCLLEADSVGAGLALCRSHSIDAVLLDYSLPDGTGLEFLEALHAQNNGGSPPVVMVTGEGSERIAVQAIKLGAEDYLVKQDLTPELLQLTMRSAIANAHLRQQLRQTERSLQKANQQITTIWESMTDAFTILDREWRISYTNPASTQVIRQLTHQEPEEFLGKTHWEILPWTVGTIVEREYQRAMAEQVAVHFEVLYEPSGDWFEAHAYPSEAGLGIYFRDISVSKRLEADRSRAEKIVQQQLTEIESIYTAAPIGLCFVDTDLRFVRINEQLAQINGLPVSEHLGRTLREIVPEMADQLEPLYRQVIESGEPILNLEVAGTNRAQPGVLRHWLVSYYPQKDLHQRVIGVNVMVQEISDRRQIQAERDQIQEALQQSEEQLRFIADTIPHIVWVTDPCGVTNYVNQRWVEYTGLNLEAALEYGWQNLLHPDDLPQVQAFWTEACQTASVYDIEYRLRRADGMFRWQLAKGRPMRDYQGQVLKWFGTCTDIHDQKQAELEREHYVEQSYRLLAEAEAARAEAEAANQSKDEFVAVVAHELRSPLNSIAGWSKLLQSRKFDEATLSKALDTIYRNTQAQVQLVEDLLDISRMVKGTLQINFAPVNCVNVIEAALDLVRPIADAKHIQLEPYLSFTPQVSGDFNRLQQIVVNLLTNAIKFTPQSGRVEVQLEQVDAQVVLRVHDTGKGIAPEFLSQIFERFKQGQQNTGSKDGLGLGLAIVKNLVELHGGTIQAESAGIGAGATFTVCLPSLEIPAIRQESFGVEATSLAGIRVLAVDDDPDMLNLITFVLQDYGAEVQAVTTAAAAIAEISQFKPDILLSDLAMPGGDGYELVQQVRSYPEGQIPVIALTAYASATDRERSHLAGFQQHLSKPVDPEDLVAAILSLVRGDRP